MPAPLKVLVATDRPQDADRLLGALREAGWEAAGPRLTAADDFRSQLTPGIDLILIGFDPGGMLRALRERGLDVPVVAVARAGGVAEAVAAMREGAADYLPWDELPRLGPAVARALGAKRLRDEARDAGRGLQAEATRYRRLLDAATAGIWIIDAANRTEFVNRRMVEMFGYAAEELVGQPLSFLLAPEDRAPEAGDDISSPPGLAECFDRRFRRKDGGEVWAIVSANPVFDDRGRYEGVLATLTDVTGRKRLEEQTRQAHKLEAVGRLAGGVAHDFNNQLTIILGYCDLLAAALPPADPSQELVREMARAGEQAAALTRQLLAFGRPQAPAPQALDLNELVTGLGTMLRHLLGEDVTLATSLCADLPAARGDPGQVEQVLMHLAVNARDAMPQGGRLTLQTAPVEFDANAGRGQPGPKSGRFVMVGVTDTGRGMDAHTRAHLFEPFFTTKEVGQGVGLGLATVYTVVQKSGGFIEVDSEPGRGSTFKVYFPQAENGPPLPAANGCRAALQAVR